MHIAASSNGPLMSTGSETCSKTGWLGAAMIHLLLHIMCDDVSNITAPGLLRRWVGAFRSLLSCCEGGAR